MPRTQGCRSEVQNCLDAGSRHLIQYFLRSTRGHCYHCNVNSLLAHDSFNFAHVVNHYSSAPDATAYFFFVVVEESHDLEVRFTESVVVGKRSSQVSCADNSYAMRRV